MRDANHEQLIANRRNQILDAAAHVFAEKGFHSTTIREIARHAEIADGTIYNYFDSKPALLLAIFERMRATILAQSPPPLPENLDVDGFVRAFLHQPLLAPQESNFALFRIIVSEMMVNDELRTLYQQHILAPTLVAAEGFLLRHCDALGLSPLQAQLIVRALAGMIFGLMVQNILGDSLLAEEWERLPDLLADLVLNGIKREQS